MANNYLQFSEILGNLTQEEATWIDTLARLGNNHQGLEEHFNPDGTGKSELGKLADKLWGEEDTYIECTVEPEQDGSYSVWFYAEEFAEPYAVGQVVQEFIRKFRPGSGMTWSLTWAEYCSKLRLGEFGGGAMIVTQDKIHLGNALTLLRNSLKE